VARTAWYGFAASSAQFRPTSGYWARPRTRTGWRAELADLTVPDDWESYARALFAMPGADTVMVYYASRDAALFAANGPVALSRGYVVAQLANGSTPRQMLAGRPGGHMPDPGAIVCAGFDVDVNTILAAIADQGLADISAIGQALQAGFNCGSCRPELQALLNGAHASAKEAAE
jgi:assimilatory nitrate reductase catalytic subunit